MRGTTHRYSTPGLGDYSGGCTPAVRIASSPPPKLVDPLNHHESGTEGGEHTYSSWIVRSGRPVPSGRIPAREGVVRLGAPSSLCQPPGLAPQ